MIIDSIFISIYWLQFEVPQKWQLPPSPESQPQAAIITKKYLLLFSWHWSYAVTAPVKWANMKMYLSEVSSSIGTEVTDNDIALTQDSTTTYYLTCEVNMASPAPTITATKAGSDLTPFSGSTITGSTTAPNFADLQELVQFSFVADISTDCSGMKLACTAFNNANTLLKAFDVATYPDDAETLEYEIASVEGE